MAGTQHLYRRDSGVFVRLCVPARLKAAVGKGEIHRSTGVRDYRLAKVVAAELVAHGHRAIQALERMDIKKIKAGSIDLLGDLRQRVDRQTLCHQLTGACHDARKQRGRRSMGRRHR